MGFELTYYESDALTIELLSLFISSFHKYMSLWKKALL